MGGSIYTLALVLTVMLVIPLVCNRMRIPTIAGYIACGMLLGQHALGLIPESSTIQTLGKVGMLYILFQSGVELDLNDLRLYRKQVVGFGIMSFALPVLLGIGVCHGLIGCGWTETLLISAMLGSHTLITYPIVSRYGIQKSRSVNIAVGGSMVAITLALLMLVSIEGSQHPATDWQAIGIGLLLIGLFLLTTLRGIPAVAQWLLKQRIALSEQYIMVMLMIVVSAALAEAAGTDAILGAFLCGIMLNTKIPNRSPLMEIINLMGGNVFVPVFLIGIGTMIDISACRSGYTVWLLALMMVGIKLSGKWLASAITQYTQGWNKQEGILLFGLTHPAAAGTLAIATIGYDMGAMSSEVMSATIIMILVMCITSSFLTDSAAKKLARAEQATLESDRDEDRWMLIRIGKVDKAPLQELARLSSLPEPVYQQVADWNEASNRIERSWESTIVYHEIQPLSTISRILVAIPRHGEKEHDFISCFGQIRRLSSELGASVVFYCTEEAEQALQAFCARPGKYLRARYKRLEDYKNILSVQRDARADDLLVFVQARKNTTSYDSVFRLLPKMLDRFFSEHSYLVLYPEQGK